jgi:hypothetical protein
MLHIESELQGSSNTPAYEGQDNAVRDERILPVVFDDVDLKHIKVTRNNLVNLAFSVKPDFRRHFGLLIGLLEFHRTSAFSFAYHRNDHRISVSINSNQYANLISLLRFIADLLVREVAFKSHLRKVIEFERNAVLQTKFLYKDLLTSDNSNLNNQLYGS